MFSDLKPYPERAPHSSRDSDLIPCHWTERRLKSLARLNPSRSEVSHEIESGAEATFLPMEAVSSSGHVDYSRRIEPLMTTAGFTYFRGRDVLVAKITPCFENGKGACLEDLPTKIGFGSTEFHVLRAGKEVTPKFLEAVTRSRRFRQLGADAMTGSAGQQRVPTEFVGCYSVALPPRTEQDLLVRFLAHANARIDRAIAAKRKMIELLDEQKRVTVNRAIRRGVDVGAPSQESVAPGVGPIPAHWQVSRLKDLATIQTGLTLGKDYVESDLAEFPYLRVANVQSWGLDLRDVKNVRLPAVDAARVRLRTGDVLMTEGGDIDKLGRATIWQGEVHGCLHQNHVFAVRCGEWIEPEYLVTVLGSAVGRDYFQLTAKQTTNLASTNSTTLRAFPLPPIEEQRRILAKLREEDALWLATTQRLRREIELLREFRTRLTADVVTGQLDVREAAAKLPDLDPAELATADVDHSDDLDAVTEEFLDEGES
ncbi:MAG: restriction endonuclease subunit S [Actinomycetota bacterium]|nr:restriction endonuclease subunit S [Actinomycetota bacterium]